MKTSIDVLQDRIEFIAAFLTGFVAIALPIGISIALLHLGLASA